MTAPEPTAPECSGCKWESFNRGSHYPGACCHAESIYVEVFKERNFGDCGPTARYYEPKETSE